MKKNSLLFIFILQSCFVSAQKPLFIGINPSFTFEKRYGKGEYDVNILPLVLQIPINERVDIRFATIYNYGVRINGNSVQHRGLELALPIFILEEKDASGPSEGFYIAPVVSFSRNRWDGYYHQGLYAEPGYFFKLGKKGGLSIGAQMGATYFRHPNINHPQRTLVRSHFGLKFIIGGWLGG